MNAPVWNLLGSVSWAAAILAITGLALWIAHTWHKESRLAGVARIRSALVLLVVIGSLHLIKTLANLGNLTPDGAGGIIFRNTGANQNGWIQLLHSPWMFFLEIVAGIIANILLIQGFIRLARELIWEVGNNLDVNEDQAYG